MDEQQGAAHRAGRTVGRVVGQAAHGTRAAIRKNPTADRVYRTTVGVTGAGTVLLGVALIPLPGPGSLIALGGLALLGTEFEGAKKTSTAANNAARKAVAKVQQKRAAKKAARDVAGIPCAGTPVIVPPR